MAITLSASYSLTVRVAIRNRPGMLGRVTSAIGEAGGDIGAVDIVELLKDTVVRDFTTDEMKIAAAQAFASIVGRRELHEEYVIPSVFNKKVVPAVAREVIQAAQKVGVARRRRRPHLH